MTCKSKVALNQEKNSDLSKLYNQLKEKEFCISKLNCEISKLKTDLERLQHEKKSHHSMSVFNNIQRVERERDSAVSKASALQFELAALEDKSKVKFKL